MVSSLYNQRAYGYCLLGYERLLHKHTAKMPVPMSSHFLGFSPECIFIIAFCEIQRSFMNYSNKKSTAPALWGFLCPFCAAKTQITSGTMGRSPCCSCRVPKLSGSQPVTQAPGGMTPSSWFLWAPSHTGLCTTLSPHIHIIKTKTK